MGKLREKAGKLPDEPGVYSFYDKDQKILYVGKANSLKKRVSSYFANKNPGPKTSLLIKKTADIKYIKVFSEFEALLLEAHLIKKNQPFFNSIAKDDKSPLYIKISGMTIPQVTVTHRQKPQKGAFLAGPFPSARVTRDVLRTIRRIFPFCHHKNPKKPCLLVHLGLCPYPYGSETAKGKYLKTIKKIKKLLGGNTKTLVSQLKREMLNFSKLQKFEEADEIKAQIQKIDYVTTTYHAPKDFIEKPTLVDDMVVAKLQELKRVLRLDKIPKRIECYDISNIYGKNATGSMVVFESGRSAKYLYRRFRIKLSAKPNDYLMLKEVLSRRFKNNWALPDLIIIDGGKGQLASALSVTSQYKIQAKVIAIAKRFEEIYTLDQKDPIVLGKENQARLLVQQIRDEAHRFANAYHRLLRSKNLLG